jgi:hypothetical protein
MCWSEFIIYKTLKWSRIPLAQIYYFSVAAWSPHLAAALGSERGSERPDPQKETKRGLQSQPADLKV